MARKQKIWLFLAAAAVVMPIWGFVALQVFPIGIWSYIATALPAMLFLLFVRDLICLVVGHDWRSIYSKKPGRIDALVCDCCGKSIEPKAD